MSKPKLKTVENARNYRRVKVSLQGAICLPNNVIKHIKTADISESGIGIVCEDDVPLTPGSKVKLHIDGVISSRIAKELDIYSMEVVHTSRNQIGLRF